MTIKLTCKEVIQIMIHCTNRLFFDHLVNTFTHHLLFIRCRHVWFSWSRTVSWIHEKQAAKIWHETVCCVRHINRLGLEN
ncbi:hypothetical protein PR048_011273 [Dryococelus australis]|uniref:Uncharacterized protein n=1 Tax=Dryococelus australis TaxID=614101 RepID=A0ABQ9HL52_9NEOP|nr:hypothetical protein PR048_011273 [Dryococelus australis]